MKMLELNKVYNMDCMEGMRQFPDKYFELAVVDPPFGGAGKEFKGYNKSRFGGRFDKYKVSRTGGTWANKYEHKIIAWDTAPDDEYFKELFRVSKEQIIWGGNYFGLPPNRCFLVWVKTNIPENFTMSMCEYAWCSMNDNAKVFYESSGGSAENIRFHPTQKPVALYDWIFRNYAKAGDKILDTHLGSGSSRIAAYDAGLDFIGFEIDKDYFEKAEERFQTYISQQSLFKMQTDKSEFQQETLDKFSSIV